MSNSNTSIGTELKGKAVNIIMNSGRSYDSIVEDSIDGFIKCSNLYINISSIDEISINAKLTEELNRKNRM